MITSRSTLRIVLNTKTTVLLFIKGGGGGHRRKADFRMGESEDQNCFGLLRARCQHSIYEKFKRNLER